MPFHFHSSKKELQQSIWLNLGFAVVEAIFGILSNSTALLSEALHDLSDGFSLGLAWLGQKQAEREPTKRFSFGFYRWSVLAAAINALVLLVVTGFIFWSAYQRFLNPQPVNGGLLALVAVVGVIVNAIVVRKLGKHKEEVSTRSAMWHMLEDLFGWIVFLVGGLLIAFTGIPWIDPLLSVLVGLFVLFGAFSVLSETFGILSEGVPKGMDVDQVTAEISKIDSVLQVHDVHIWSLGAGVSTLSCHISLPEMPLSQARLVMDQIEQMLLSKYHIQHATIEAETGAKTCPPGKKCD